MGPHWGPYRLGDGRGPEEAPGAGGHHEAGDVGHGERVRSRRVGDRDVLRRLNVDRLRRVDLQGLTRKRRLFELVHLSCEIAFFNYLTKYLRF